MMFPQLYIKNNKITSWPLWSSTEANIYSTLQVAAGANHSFIVLIWILGHGYWDYYFYPEGLCKVERSSLPSVSAMFSWWVGEDKAFGWLPFWQHLKRYLLFILTFSCFKSLPNIYVNFAAKAPLLAYNSFIEAIYVLNDCTGHGAHSESQRSSDRRPALFAIRWDKLNCTCRNNASSLAELSHAHFCFSGTDERSRSKRMHIYASLLKQMAPEHLLATSAKLCAEILAGVCDGLLSVDDAGGRAVLQVGITWFPANMKYLIIFLKKNQIPRCNLWHDENCL